MKYTIEIATDGMIYTPSFMKIFFGHSGNIKAATSTIGEAVVLVILLVIGIICDICH
jgi:hypothetical protein